MINGCLQDERSREPEREVHVTSGPLRSRARECLREPERAKYMPHLLLPHARARVRELSHCVPEPSIARPRA